MYPSKSSKSHFSESAIIKWIIVKYDHKFGQFAATRFHKCLLAKMGTVFAKDLKRERTGYKNQMMIGETQRWKELNSIRNTAESW